MTDQPANQPPESADNDYDRLLEKWKRLAYLEDVERVLSWDEYTVVPEGGAPARSKQQGALSTVIQQQRTDDDFGHFEKHLDRIVELKREEATAINPDADPYGVLFAEYAPYTDL